MSQDKRKTVFPVSVGFVAGEQPNDRKLTGWGTQDKNAFTAIETSVGDLYDSNTHTGTSGGSHSYDLSNRKLTITSLARVIGPASMLNPEYVTRHGTFTVTVTLGAFNTVERHWYLPFPPRTYSAGVWSDATVTPGGTEAASFTDRKGAIDLVEENGDWYVDFDTGHVYSYRGVANGSTATLQYNCSLYPDLYEEASFNVIPDFNESTALCTIASSGTGYTVDCPFMLRTVDNTSSLAGSNFDLGRVGDTPAQLLSTIDLSLFLGALNTAAADDPRDGNQITLPSVLRDNLASGDSIPEGFVLLYDENTDSLVEGCTFEYRSATQVFVQPPAGTSLAIGSTRYRLITVGTSLANAVKTVATRFRQHRHDGVNGDSPISHLSLLDRYPSYDVRPGSANAKNTFYESGMGAYVNPHPQYLHRLGYSASDATTPSNSGNAMRGDLVIGSTSATSDFLNLSDQSYSLLFGDPSNGPFIRFSDSGDSANNLARSTILASRFPLLADSGIAAGNTFNTTATASIDVLTPVIKWLSLQNLQADKDASDANKQWVRVLVDQTAGTATDVWGYWDIAASDLPSDFVIAAGIASAQPSILFYSVAPKVITGSDTWLALPGQDLLYTSTSRDGDLCQAGGIAFIDGTPDMVRFYVWLGSAFANTSYYTILVGYMV